MAAGRGFTVRVFERVQPVPVMVQTVVNTPGLIPVTIPLDEPMVAIASALLLQVTPEEELNVTVLPTHTEDGPAIFRADAHLKRFCASAEVYGLRIPFSPEMLMDAMCALIRLKHQFDNGIGAG